MEYIFHPYSGYMLLGLALLYIVTATLFLLTAKLKNEKGELYIDQHSLHFKIAFPFRKYNNNFMMIINNGQVTIGLCPYFFQFFTCLYFAWPIIIVWQTVKTLIYGPLLLLDGRYPDPFDLEVMTYSEIGPFAMETYEYRLPKVGGQRIAPIVPLLIVIYIWAAFFAGGAISFWTLSITAGLIVLIIGLVILGEYLDWKEKHKKKEEQEEESLVGLRLKYRKLCPILKIK